MDAEVIVIGAGAAGLAAAERLCASGRRVLVLEARDRIGGRVHTDRTFAGFPVERGTVSDALRSGTRAAGEVIKTL